MGALMRAYDWSSTSVGPVAEWPQSLRTAVGVLLNSRHPMFIWWGPDLVQFYNDAYRRSLGSDRHPSALGQGGRECWAEIWPTIGPEVEAVMAAGEATWHEDHLVPITRGDRVQDVYWSYSYSPILDDDGGVGGVLVTVQETTRRVFTERRARLLQQLATRELQAESALDTVAVAIAVLEQHPEDVAFALLYLHDTGEDTLRLAGAAGLAAGHPAGPCALDALTDGIWPVARAAGSQASVHVEHLPSAVGEIRRELWPEPVREALVVPLVTGSGSSGTRGVLVAGMSPRLTVDEDCRTFFDQVAREIAHALDKAEGVEQERRAWRAAERAEARLARVYEQAPVAMAVLRGPDHVFEIANARYAEIVAGARSLLGRPIREALPELAGQGIYELLDETFASGTPYVAHERSLMIARGPRGDIDEAIYNWVYEPLLDERGQVEGIAVVATEVTELVRARQAAEHAAAERDAERQHLARIFELSPTFLAVLRGPDLVFELANPAYHRLIGHRAVVGKPVRVALPEVEGQGFFELLDGVYRAGEPFVGNELPVQMQRTPATGLETRYVNFVYQPMRGPNGTVNGILASGTDVTELVEAREAAERLALERDLERRQLLTVLEQSPLAIVLVEAPSGRVTFANERVRQIFGHAYLSERVESNSDEWHGLHPDGRRIASEEWPISRAIQRGEVVANETVWVDDAAGRRAEIVINAAPVRDAQGSIIAGVAMFWDVTAERRTERQLRDAERLQSVGTLAGGVAHEVNNQMTTVLGFGEFILRALGPDHPQAADVRVVLTAADRTARITNQLLTFSRKQVTQPRVVDLRALTLGLRPVLQQLLGNDKELLITGAADARPVTVDPTQVEQVLINLVANARDATDTGGKVTIGVEHAELTSATALQRDIPVTPGPYVLLTVSDTGCGMDASTLARVFEPFFTTKRIGEGTGLGLSMVYGIVKRHGGYIWAESVPGHGTSLKLYWPAAGDAATVMPEPGAGSAVLHRHAEAGAAPTVLVVEDEPSVRELVVRILKVDGYRVLAAEDGQDAIRLLSSHPVPPDLVVTDVLMPRMNGRQLGDALREMHPWLPVLYMSGDIGESIVLRQLVPDGAPFLRKPFTPSQLLASISAVLHRL
jgi:PAS domain S-box-containing protein